MFRLDRKRQLLTLQILFNAYPRSLDDENKDELRELYDSHDDFLANLLYLEEHGLIVSGVRPVADGFRYNTDHIKITAKGVDFIQQDGGLSAILNVQTIKFHRDAVIILEDLIAISNMNDEQKEKARSTLGEMSTEAIKTVVQAVTTAGFSALLGK